MKKLVIVSAVAAALAAPSAVLAQASTSPHTFSGNVGVVSDYLFRGISQTHGKPAIQGGFDYSHASGLYAGTWLSSISWVQDAQARSVPTEIDLYGGFKNSFAGTYWGYDVGFISYNYPGTITTAGSAKANTAEVYGGLSWKWLSAKYSHTTSSHFVGWYGGPTGTNTSIGTRGSNYLELNASYDLGSGWGITGHMGKQKVKNYVPAGDTNASYTDWKIGVTKDVGFGVVALAYSDTNSKGTCVNAVGGTNAYCWGSAGGTADFKDTSKGTAFLSFTKSF